MAWMKGFPGNIRPSYMTALVGVLLSFLILVTYLQVREFQFISFDDPMYVTENRHVLSGLTLKNAAWAFSSIYAGNWHPLTWLSHMTDVTLFGLEPGMHHLTNVVLHAANSVLLFLLLFGMTGAAGRSAFVAAVFGLHPVHVESVAWIAERKDVLSTFFGMLALVLYARYARQPGIGRYVAVFLCFMLSLLSKPMLVTLPFVFLLFDLWPLDRFSSAGGRASGKAAGSFRLMAGLVLEKAPFFLLSALSCVVTFYAQHKGGAVNTLELLPLSSRVGNAVISYAAYLGKAVLPVNLAVFYPYPHHIELWKVLAAGAVLAAITALVFMQAKKRRYLAVGWLFYIGTLFPVAGIVQVGSQAMADRYLYVPLIGLLIMAAWGMSDLLERFAFRRHVLAGTAVGAVILCALLTSVQTGYWKDSETLFSRAIDVTQENCLAHNSLGGALQRKGDLEKAVFHYRRALALVPDYKLALNNLGAALSDQGKRKEAVSLYRRAIRLYPDFPDAHYNLGVALSAEGKNEEALLNYREAVRLNPAYAKAHYNLGVLLSATGKNEEALRHYNEAVRLGPEYAEARNNLGFLLARIGRYREAVYQYREALRIDPGFLKAVLNLGSAYSSQGDIDGAIALVKEAEEKNPREISLKLFLAGLYLRRGEIDHAAGYYDQVLSANPADTHALHGIASAYSQKGDYETALSFLKRIIRAKPENSDGYYNIACMYARLGNSGEAVSWLRKALGLGFNDWNTLKKDPDLEGIRHTGYYRSIAQGR